MRRCSASTICRTSFFFTSEMRPLGFFFLADDLFSQVGQHLLQDLGHGLIAGLLFRLVHRRQDAVLGQGLDFLAQLPVIRRLRERPCGQADLLAHRT